MPDRQARFEELLAALRERDYRLTPQRIELVRLIAVSENHPSAAQLYVKIQEKFPTMSHATVYKTLTLLKELNQVLEIDLAVVEPSVWIDLSCLVRTLLFDIRQAPRARKMVSTTGNSQSTVTEPGSSGTATTEAPGWPRWPSTSCRCARSAGTAWR